MYFFRDELKTTKASHKKLKARLRALHRYIILHYVLLGLSLAQSGVALFIVVNYAGPYKEALFAFLSASLVLGVFLFVSGLAK
jgi:hypothetical protein